MLDPLRRLLSDASAAKDTKAFWRTVAQEISEWAGGARAEVLYDGLTDTGVAVAGPEAGTGARMRVESRDGEGRHVTAAIEGPPATFQISELRAVLEVALHLAVMVGRRVSLERERRLGTFLVELSRWLLAAPDRELLLRYTLQSLMSLVEAQGAYVALRNPDGDSLRVAACVGRSIEMHGVSLPLNGSTTGRVVTTGEPVITEDISQDPDAHAPAFPSGTARAAMIAPLRTSAGVVGAVGVVRYVAPATPREKEETTPPPFTLVEMQYLTAVGAHIAGGLELAEAVAGVRAAAEQARAMVNGSPLPLALVDRGGRVEQLNQAGCRLFGIGIEAKGLGRHLEALGLSASGLPIHVVLARALEGEPWHGRVLVTRSDGDRRICDCTVTGLAGADSTHLLVALYDRTDELRAERELVAREKLATVGEIASGVAHEVNNPLAAIRMEAELLARASTDPEVTAAATTMTREVDRAARIVRSLLRLARRADTTPTRVYVNELIRDVAEIRHRVLRSENVEFRMHVDGDAPPVLGLGQELQQVVINLVTNAEHAIKGRTPAIIQITTEAKNGWVRLVVEDSGQGVSREIRHRIFDPFFTTKGPDEGTGLGLAICQRVVSEVGGKIWYEESTLGGARFVVELPAAPEDFEENRLG
jgi:signal transduction histidine kinase